MTVAYCFHRTKESGFSGHGFRVECDRHCSGRIASTTDFQEELQWDRHRRVSVSSWKRRRKNATRNATRWWFARNAGLAEQLLARSKAPIHECCVSANLEEQGLGQVVISRRTASGEIAVGVFLIDRYCMGVKDCFGHIMTGARFAEVKEDMQANGQNLQKIDAASARRVIEDAVAYAENLSIKPHADFRSARIILADIDSSTAKVIFEIGKDGKPFFMSGPFQSPAEYRMILSKLTAKCGADGFSYLLKGNGPHGSNLPFEFEDLSFEDSQYDNDDDEEDEEGDVDEDGASGAIELVENDRLRALEND